MQPLLRQLAAAYSAHYGYVSFEFSAVGSTAGLEVLRRGSADLALVSRKLQPEEELDISTGKRTLVFTVIARDGIAVIVNEKNPLRALTTYQIRNVFEGQVTTWEELGGPTEDIVVVSREDGSGTRVVFEELSMHGHRVTSTALIMPGSEAVRQYVAAHSGAIGYVSIGCLGPGVVPVSVDGIGPEQKSIEQGSYALTRPFVLVCRTEPPPDVARFLSFATSASGQAIVRRTYGEATTGSQH